MGDALVAQMRDEFERFYELTGHGALEPIALFFSEVAGEQMPPEMVMAVLRITQEQKLAAQRERKLLQCTKEQFMTAMKTAWEDGDSIDTYRQRLGKHTARLQNGLHVITELRPQLQAFHAKYKGSVDKVAALFSQLAPEPAKGKPLPPGMIHMLLRVPKDAKACSLEDLIECLQRNVEAEDTVDRIRPYLEKSY